MFPMKYCRTRAILLAGLLCSLGVTMQQSVTAADRYAADRALAERQREMRAQQSQPSPERTNARPPQANRTVSRNVNAPPSRVAVERPEYQQEYRPRQQRSRVAPSAHYDQPPRNYDDDYEEAAPGEWEEGYAPGYDGARVSYDVFDEEGFSPLDGDHYQQPYSGGGCNSCGGDSCGGCDSCGGYDSCGGCVDRCGFGGGLIGAAYDCGLWVKADYLLWWTSGESLPPLVTTSPYETPRTEAGVLGQPDTEIVYGDGFYLNEARSGGRIEFGGWLDGCRTIGAGGGFFGLGDGSSTYSASSDGDPIIARPFYNTLTDAQDSALTAYSSTAGGGVTAGDILVLTSNDLVNANAFLTKQMWRDCRLRVDALAGYRFSRFDEDLAITENFVVTETDSFVPLGTTFNAIDSFDVTNRFNGGELGFKFEGQFQRWSLDGLLKVGLGGMYQEANIWGRTTVTPPGSAPDVREGDLYALPSNIGTYSRNKFAVVPEVRLNLNYCITPTWRVNVGYTFMYWSEVVRAGSLVNPELNVTQLLPPVIGPAVPTFTFVNGDLWAQGLNFGTELRF